MTKSSDTSHQAPMRLRAARKQDPRTQFAALPYRRRKGQVQVLLITSLDTDRWILPKGWPMDGCTPAATAAQEAWEEAGIRLLAKAHIQERSPGGIIVRPSILWYAVTAHLAARLRWRTVGYYSAEAAHTKRSRHRSHGHTTDNKGRAVGHTTAQQGLLYTQALRRVLACIMGGRPAAHSTDPGHCCHARSPREQR